MRTQKKQKNKKILSAVLSVVMLLSMLPLHAFADQPPTNTKEITAITAFEDAILSQEFTVGDENAEVKKPDTISAEVTTTTYEEVTITPTEQEDGVGTLEEVADTVWNPVTTTEDVELEISWVEPDFTTNNEATFTYTASLKDEGYTFAEGVSLPEIVVSVVPATVLDDGDGPDGTGNPADLGSLKAPATSDIEIQSWTTLTHYIDITIGADGNITGGDFPTSVGYNHGKTIDETANGTDITWRLYSSDIGVTIPSGDTAIATDVEAHKDLYKMPGTYTYVLQMPDGYYTEDENLNFPIAQVKVKFETSATLDVDDIPELHSNTATQKRFVGVTADKPIVPDAIKVQSDGNTYEVPVKWKLQGSDPAVYLDSYNPATVGELVYEAEIDTAKASVTVNLDAGLAMPTITVDVIPLDVYVYIDGTNEDIYQGSSITSPPNPTLSEPSIPDMTNTHSEKGTVTREIQDGKTFSTANVGDTFTYMYLLDTITYKHSLYDPYTDDYMNKSTDEISYDLPADLKYELGEYTYNIIAKPTGVQSVDIERIPQQFISVNSLTEPVFPNKVNIIGDDSNGNGALDGGSGVIYYIDSNNNGVFDSGETNSNSVLTAMGWGVTYKTQVDTGENFTTANQEEVHYVEVKYADYTELYEVTWELVSTPTSPMMRSTSLSFDSAIEGKYVYEANFTGRKIKTLDNISYWYEKDAPENNPPTLPTGVTMPKIEVNVVDRNKLNVIKPIRGTGTYDDPYIYHMMVGQYGIIEENFPRDNDYDPMDAYYKPDNIAYNPSAGVIVGLSPGADMIGDLDRFATFGTPSNPHAWVIVLDEAQEPEKTVNEAMLASGNFEIVNGKITYKHHTVEATKTAKWIDADAGKGEIELMVKGLDAHIPTNADIILVFDASSSLPDNGIWNNAMEVLHQAGQIFFDNNNENNVRVALVPFASDTHSGFNFVNNVDSYDDGIDNLVSPKTGTRTNYSMALAHAAAYAEMRTAEDEDERPLQVIFFTDGSPTGYGNTYEYSPNTHAVDDYALSILDNIGSSRLAISLHYPGDSDSGAATLRKIHNLEENYADGYLRLEHKAGIDPAYLQIVTSMFDCASNIVVTDLISEHFTVIQTDTNFTTGISDGSIKYTANVGGQEQVEFFIPKLDPKETVSLKIPIQLKDPEMASGGNFPTNHDVTGNLGADVNYVNFLWDVKGLELATPHLPYPNGPTVNHTVTFVSNGGSAEAPQTVPDNGTATEPSDPTRTGYTFKGWYTDDTTFANDYNFATLVTADVTLYAKWQDDGGGGGGGGTSTTYYDIEIEIEGSGTVSPDGGSDDTVRVEKGDDQNFTMTPASGWYIDDVLVNGVSIGKLTAYEFENVRKDHVIKVIFKETGGTTGPVDPTPPPTGPTDPTTPPTDPTVPPTTPTTPPTEPAKPETNIPQTGDSSNVMMWFLLALASGLGLLGLNKKGIIYKGKRVSTDDE